MNCGVMHTYGRIMKMRKMMIFSVAAVMLLCSSGCVYSNFRVPVSRDFSNTKKAEKMGVSKCHSAVWLIGWGDAGLQAAAEEGGLNTLEYVDYEYMNILFGLYMSRKTIVYGQ